MSQLHACPARLPLILALLILIGGAGGTFQIVDRAWANGSGWSVADGPKITPSSANVAWFGNTMALAKDVLAVADGQHTIFFYHRTQSATFGWTAAGSLQMTNLTSIGALTISADGNTLVVGAPHDGVSGNVPGAAYIYRRDPNAPESWALVRRIVAADSVNGDRFGDAVAISGNTIVVGMQNRDLVSRSFAYVFERNQGGPDAWGEVMRLEPPAPSAGTSFGYNVAIDGDTLLVAEYVKRVHVFERGQDAAEPWRYRTTLSPPSHPRSDSYGQTLDVEGDTILVGAPYDDAPYYDGRSRDSGAVYLYERDYGGLDAWGQVVKLASPHREAGGRFGIAAQLSGDVVAIGAFHEDAGAFQAGAAYAYHRDVGPQPGWSLIRRILPPDGPIAGHWFGLTLALDGDAIAIRASQDPPGLPSPIGSVYTFQLASTAPTISAPTDAQTAEDTPSAPITIQIGDAETAASRLRVRAQSTNPALIPPDRLTLSGSGAERTLTITPAPDQHGTAQITLTVDDHIATTTASFTLTVTPVNDPPTDLALSDATIAEHAPSGTPVGRLSAADIDSPSISYRLASGAGDSDNADFQIIGDELRTATSFDAETRTSYQIRVAAADGAGGSVERAFGITVIDRDIAPTITSDLPPGGQYGQPYRHTFRADGEPMAGFALIGGTLPAGLSLAPDGTLSGVPRRAGVFAGIIVAAQNGVQPSATQMLTISVAPAPLTVTAEPRARTYGAANPSLTFAVTGLLLGDTPATALTGALSTAATAGSPVGTYPIGQGSLSAADYTIQFTGAELTIAPAPLRVSVGSYTITAGDPLPTVAISYTGWVLGETPAALISRPSVALPDLARLTPGTYELTAHGGSAPNYRLTYRPGTLTVLAPPRQAPHQIFFPLMQ